MDWVQHFLLCNSDILIRPVPVPRVKPKLRVNENPSRSVGATDCHATTRIEGLRPYGKAEEEEPSAVCHVNMWLGSGPLIERWPKVTRGNMKALLSADPQATSVQHSVNAFQISNQVSMFPLRDRSVLYCSRHPKYRAQGDPSRQRQVWTHISTWTLKWTKCLVERLGNCRLWLIFQAISASKHATRLPLYNLDLQQNNA